MKNNESKDKRTGWLAELKEGDEVFVRTALDGSYLGKVARITPTGRISVSGRVFNHTGVYRCSGYYSIVLVQATQEGIMRYKAQKVYDDLVEKMVRHAWSEVPTEKLVKINEILEGK